jgi:hypothetical protein
MTLILWLLIDNFNEPMVLVNRNTIYVGIVLLVMMVSLRITRIVRRKTEMVIM